MKCVVIGSSGGIGAALARALEHRGEEVMRVARGTPLALDLLDEASIVEAAASVGLGVHLVINATGFLHDERFKPEKALREIDAAHLAHSFAINATGPALLMKHFIPLLVKEERGVFATLSARVGSITDNRLGGWHSYRAAKAALNQLVRTAAIEMARTRPLGVCISLHPGTVRTRLSDPFSASAANIQAPQQAAEKLLSVIDNLTPDHSGQFLDYQGRTIEF